MNFRDYLQGLSDDELINKTRSVLFNELSGINVSPSRKEDVFIECESRNSLYYEIAWKQASENAGAIISENRAEYLSENLQSMEIQKLLDNLLEKIRRNLLTKLLDVREETFAEMVVKLDFGKLLFIKVSGDSMINANIYHGDLLAGDRNLVPRNGDIVIVNINGNIFVKRYFADGSKVIFKSANPKYPDFTADESIQWKMEAVIIMKINDIN